MDTSKNTAGRIVLLLLGIAVMTFAMALMTKADMGISPVQSAAYVISEKCPLSFGTLAVIWNIIQIICQIILAGKIRLYHILQIPFSFLFGLFVDLFSLVVSGMVLTSFAVRVIVMMAGTFLLAVGIACTVKANLIMNPGEATVRSISEKCGKPFGTVKLLFDASIVATAVVLIFLLFGEFKGDMVGLGTLFSVLVTGPSVKVTLKLLDKIGGRHANADTDG